MWDNPGLMAYDDEGPYRQGPEEAQGAHYWLILGQSHLFFDQEGRFLGLKLDDMSDWLPRLPTP
jgi:hypothetical protein